MSRAFDVVGLGENAVDTVVIVPTFPPYGGKTIFHSEMLSPGGQVASAVVTCNKLGLRSKYIGSIGDDFRGRIQLKSLEESGVDISDVQIRTDCPNQSAYIVIDERTGERTIFSHRPKCLTIDPEQIQPEQIACARLLHVDGHDTPAVARAVRLARENGVEVAVDVDTIYHGFDEVLPYVDYLVASTEFPKSWTNERDPFRALDLIQREFGMKVAAMTLGAHGAMALVDGNYTYSPAFVVDCKDTTGAGDVFHGAFNYGVLKGLPIEKTLDLANAMAALNCKSLGARGGIRTLEEAERLIATGERRANPDFQARAGG